MKAMLGAAPDKKVLGAALDKICLERG